MALQLNHVHLKTHDPEKTARFYVETLGAKIVGQAGSNGYRLDLHGLSLNVTTFLESQTREQKYGMEHIAIDTDELGLGLSFGKRSKGWVLDIAIIMLHIYITG